MVEGGDAKLLVRVLLDDAKGVIMCVEGGHEDERDVDPVGSVQVLDLPHGKVEEGHVVLNFKSGLGTSHTHGGTQATVDLEDGKFIEDGRIRSIFESIKGDDLVSSRRLDTVPVPIRFIVSAYNVFRQTGKSINIQLLTLSLFSQVTSEKVEERLHFSVKGLITVVSH